MLIQLFIECITLDRIFICVLVSNISCLFWIIVLIFFWLSVQKIDNTTDNTLPHQNRWCANVMKIALKCKFGNKFNNWSETKYKASYIRIKSINSCVSNIQRIITFLDISFQRTYFHKINNYTRIRNASSAIGVRLFSECIKMVLWLCFFFIKGCDEQYSI